MPYFNSWSHLHPYSAHRAAYVFQRGPRRFLPRLLWFGVGAGAYAMWTRHVESQRQLVEGRSAEYMQSPSASTSLASSTMPPSSRVNVEVSPAEKIREVGEQAGSVMTEISESTLDALMTSLQSLRSKLAETREQRELGRDADKLYLEHRLPSDENDSLNSRGPSLLGRAPPSRRV